MTSSRPAPFARIRISGELLDPLDVAKALRLPADHSHRRGEPRLQRDRDGAVREYPAYTRGSWSMCSRPWVRSAELDVHLRWLLEQLEPRRAELQRLQAAGAEAELVCHVTELGEEATPLPAQTLGRCVALGLPVVHEPSVDPSGLPAGDGP
jgi:hypothetical protein